MLLTHCLHPYELEQKASEYESTEACIDCLGVPEGLEVWLLSLHAKAVHIRARVMERHETHFCHWWDVGSCWEEQWGQCCSPLPSLLLSMVVFSLDLCSLWIQLVSKSTNKLVIVKAIMQSCDCYSFSQLPSSSWRQNCDGNSYIAFTWKHVAFTCKVSGKKKMFPLTRFCIVSSLR